MFIFQGQEHTFTFRPCGLVLSTLSYNKVHRDLDHLIFCGISHRSTSLMNLCYLIRHTEQDVASILDDSGMRLCQRVEEKLCNTVV